MTASLITELSNLGSAFWILAAMAVLISAGSGFGAGLYYARWNDRRSFQRARAGIAQLYQTVMSTIETAQEVCLLLEKCPGKILRPEQTENLIERRNSLLDTIGRLIRRGRPDWEENPQSDGQKDSDEITPQKPFEIQWVTDPTDESTGLPGRKVFDENLSNLVEAASDSDCQSGVLLLRIDKFEGLRKRVGMSDAEKIIKKLTNVVCRSVRDQDLVCRYSQDALAVLLPDVDIETGQTISGAIRDSVRAYHFRAEEHGPEIFVTASFGYSTCRPHDNPDLVVNRAADALSKSQQRGRNQLHTHDGQSLRHCMAS